MGSQTAFESCEWRAGAKFRILLLQKKSFKMKQLAILVSTLCLLSLTHARARAPCKETNSLFTKCADLTKEPRLLCAPHLVGNYAEASYMECMRDHIDYSNICDMCICTMTGRSDWNMCQHLV